MSNFFENLAQADGWGSDPNSNKLVGGERVLSRSALNILIRRFLPISIKIICPGFPEIAREGTHGRG
jgi:hypothetical protein